MSICKGEKPDLMRINQIITEAAMAWPMGERIKRLSVPVLCYDSEDFKHYQFALYKEDNLIVAVAAWNAEMPVVTPRGTGRLLHGLYVAPSCQGNGYGQLLMAHVAAEAKVLGANGLLVKAERPAIKFFEHCGLQLLPANGPTDYPYQFWYQLDG
jgi:GNAT superfamily N-acetyltransferase